VVYDGGMWFDPAPTPEPLHHLALPRRPGSDSGPAQHGEGRPGLSDILNGSLESRIGALRALAPRIASDREALILVLCVLTQENSEVAPRHLRSEAARLIGVHLLDVPTSDHASRLLAEGVLIERLHDPVREVRTAVLGALRPLLHHRAVYERGLAVLDRENTATRELRGDFEHRRVFVRELAHVAHIPFVRESLLRLLTAPDPNWEVRATVIDSLAPLLTERTIRPEALRPLAEAILMNRDLNIENRSLAASHASALRVYHPDRYDAFVALLREPRPADRPRGALIRLLESHCGDLPALQGGHLATGVDLLRWWSSAHCGKTEFERVLDVLSCEFNRCTTWPPPNWRDHYLLADALEFVLDAHSPTLTAAALRVWQMPTSPVTAPRSALLNRCETLLSLIALEEEFRQREAESSRRAAAVESAAASFPRLALLDPAPIEPLLAGLAAWSRAAEVRRLAPHHLARLGESLVILFQRDATMFATLLGEVRTTGVVPAELLLTSLEPIDLSAPREIARDLLLGSPEEGAAAIRRAAEEEHHRAGSREREDAAHRVRHHLRNLPARVSLSDSPEDEFEPALRACEHALSLRALPPAELDHLGAALQALETRGGGLSTLIDRLWRDHSPALRAAVAVALDRLTGAPWAATAFAELRAPRYAGDAPPSHHRPHREG